MFRPDLKQKKTGKLTPKLKKAANGKTIPQLVAQLDEIYSIYRRLTEADKDGMVKCATCPSWLHYSRIQCGHFISRKHYAIRWEDRNTAPQCVHCNIFSQGKQLEFSQYVLKRYGEGVIEELTMKKNNKFKLEPFILKHLIAEYKTRVTNLKVNNGF